MNFVQVRSTISGWIGLALCIMSLCACQPAAARPIAAASQAAPTPTSRAATPTSAPTPSAAPSPTPTPAALWLPAYLPERLRNSLALPEGMQLAAQESEASLRLDAAAAEAIQEPGAIPWVYALAAPFSTIADEASLADLQRAWSDEEARGLPLKTLLVDPSTLAIFEKLWGKASGLVQALPAEKILDSAWAAPGTWAIVPFEAL